MYIRFEDIHDDSRIWCFPSANPLTAQKVLHISMEMRAFCDQWVSHHSAVDASFQWINNQVCVVGANTEKMGIGGCSIDTLMSKVKEVNEKNSLDLFCRDLLFFDKNKAHHSTCSLKELEWLLKKDEFDTNLLLLDTTISKKKDLKDLLKPIEKSWINGCV